MYVELAVPRASRNWLSEFVEPMKLPRASSMLSTPEVVVEEDASFEVLIALESFPMALVVVLSPSKLVRDEEREDSDDPAESVVNSIGHPPFHCRFISWGTHLLDKRNSR